MSGCRRGCRGEEAVGELSRATSPCRGDSWGAVVLYHIPNPSFVSTGSSSTKWLDFGGGGSGGSAFLELRLLAGQPPAVVATYDLVSANDCPERDPSSWVLEGLLEGVEAPTAGTAAGAAAQWETLDEQSGVRFGSRLELRTFFVPPERWRACRSLRLRILATRDPAAANSVQLACLNLYDAAPLTASRQSPPVPAAGVAHTADGAGAAEADIFLSAFVEKAGRSVVAALAGGGGTVAAMTGTLPPAPSATPDDLASSSSARLASMLLRLLSNIDASPVDAKFRRVRASKLPIGLLQCPQAVALLMACGFRPLLLRPEGGGAGTAPPEEEPFLVHACGETPLAMVRRAAAVLRELMPPAITG